MEVGRQGERSAATPFDLLGDGIEIRGPLSHEDDCGALRSQAPRDGGTDADRARSPGYDRHSVRETLHHEVSPTRPMTARAAGVKIDECHGGRKPRLPVSG